MGYRETLLLPLAIASAFPFLSTTGATKTTFDADSWDMVVAYDNKIYFFKNDTEIRKSTVANIIEITSLAYDSGNRTLYISDRYDIRSAVVEENLDSELTFNRILHTGDDPIYWMFFDPVTKTLFWLEWKDLMKMQVASYEMDSAPKISKSHQTSSVDLALDICHRFIYWAHKGMRESSISRSRLDGTDTEVILRSDSPVHFYGLTVDHYGGKLYFGSSEKYRDGIIKIEESNLDGTDRRVLVNGSDNNVTVPSRLAVDDTAVYWTDHLEARTIWKVYKNGTAMREIKTSFSQVDPFHYQSNILTSHTVESIDCKAVLDKEQIRTPEQSQVAARLEQLSDKMDRLLTNQNQLLLALIGLLEDARLTHTAAISRIDALKPNLLDNVPHPEN